MNNPATDRARAMAQVHDAPLVRADATSLMDVISRAASDPNTDVDKLERILGMYERITARESEQAFNEAMTAAQAEIRPIAADTTNHQTKSKYASYAALDQSLRPIYTKHGFALSFDTGDGAPENYVRVLCHVSHKAGHSRTPHIDMPADGKGAKGGDVMTKTHAVGSGVTYGQRYLLKLIFNIAIGDDDGNAASDTDGTIDEAQTANILDLIERSQANIEAFCKYMKIEAVPELRARDYFKACELLNTKLRQKK